MLGNMISVGLSVVFYLCSVLYLYLYLILISIFQVLAVCFLCHFTHLFHCFASQLTDEEYKQYFDETMFRPDTWAAGETVCVYCFCTWNAVLCCVVL